jgi:hypothetical protein
MHQNGTVLVRALPIFPCVFNEAAAKGWADGANPQGKNLLTGCNKIGLREI